MDEQVTRRTRGTPYPCTQVIMLHPVPTRSLREERLKDIHLKPVHAPLKGEEEGIAGEPTLP
jgi:hypothetical protein